MFLIWSILDAHDWAQSISVLLLFPGWTNAWSFCDRRNIWQAFPPAELTSVNSSAWTQQNRTPAEKHSLVSIQHAGNWRIKPFNPSCLQLSSTKLGNHFSHHHLGTGGRAALLQIRGQAQYGWLSTQEGPNKTIKLLQQTFISFQFISLCSVFISCSQHFPVFKDLSPLRFSSSQKKSTQQNLDPYESIPEGMVLAKTKLEALQPSVSASWLQLWISMR